MNKLRKEFPVARQNTYLNTASSGLLYDSLLEYRQDHDLDFLIGGSNFRDNQQQLLNSVKQSVKKFFSCTLGDVVLSPNFSIGLNIFLEGIDKTKKILLLDTDYPSINLAVTTKFSDVCYAKIDAQLEQNITKTIKEHNPDIFIFSVVQYINGISIDLDFIKDLKTKYPTMLIVADATQFCGTKFFDFDNSGIDILGCSGYKWLLAGYGNGFFLFKKNILETTTPLLYKTNTSASKYDNSYTTPKARYECGHLDTLAFGSLQYSLKFLSNIKINRIEEHLRELVDYTKEELAKMNLLEPSVVERKKHSSIFNITGDKSLFDRLTDQGITTSLRGDGIRISLHIYNSIEDITKLLKVLH